MEIAYFIKPDFKSSLSFPSETPSVTQSSFSILTTGYGKNQCAQEYIRFQVVPLKLHVIFSLRCLSRQ